MPACFFTLLAHQNIRPGATSSSRPEMEKLPLMALPMLAILGMLASLRKRTNVGEDGTKL